MALIKLIRSWNLGIKLSSFSKAKKPGKSNHWWFPNIPQSTAPQKRRPLRLVTKGKEACQLDAFRQEGMWELSKDPGQWFSNHTILTLINIILLNLSLNSTARRRADLCVMQRYNEGAVLWWLPGVEKKPWFTAFANFHGVNIHIAANSKLLFQCQEFTKILKI